MKTTPKQVVSDAQAALEELRGRHAAAIDSANTTLSTATKAKQEAYDCLLNARANGQKDISDLKERHEKAAVALNEATLESDTSRKVASLIEPLIESAKAELAQAEAALVAARIDCLKEAANVGRERSDRLKKEVDDEFLKGLVIHNRISILLRADGAYNAAYTHVTFERDTLLTYGAAIAAYEAETEAMLATALGE